MSSSPFILIINNTKTGEVRHTQGNAANHLHRLLRKEFEYLNEYLRNNPPKKNAKLDEYDSNEYVLKVFDSKKKKWIDNIHVIHKIFHSIIMNAYYKQNLNIIENYF
jgi:hypothetical protein